MSETIIIDTPEAIAAYRLRTLIFALRTEINTGLKVTRVPLLRVASEYGVTARTKKRALAELESLYEQATGHRA